MIEKSNNQNLKKISDYVLVNLINPKYKLDDILHLLNNGLNEDIFILEDYCTICGSEYMYSPTYLALNCLLQLNSKDSILDGWYDGNIDSFEVNTIFYDEFVFLSKFNLLEYDDLFIQTLDDIWGYVKKEELPSGVESIFNDLYTAMTLSELKSAYRKLLHKHHPDKGGDSKTLREILVVYSELKRKFK